MGVRAAKIESGMEIMIIKQEFIEFITSEAAIKASRNFDITIKKIDHEWVTVKFIGKNDTADLSRDANVTDLFMNNIKN